MSTIARPRTWHAFERRLAAALERLPSNHYLILEARASGRYVQYAKGPDDLRAETQSNDFAPAELGLSATDEAALVALGWTPPPEGRDHKVNFARAWAVPAPWDEAAQLAAATFGCYRVGRPSAIRYGAFARGGGSYSDPELGLARLKPRTNVSRRPAAGQEPSRGTGVPRLMFQPPRPLTGMISAERLASREEIRPGVFEADGSPDEIVVPRTAAELEGRRFFVEYPDNWDELTADQKAEVARELAKEAQRQVGIRAAFEEAPTPGDSRVQVPPCPACAATDATPIRYGFPSVEMIEAFQRGEIALGGCILEAESPRWQCRACGTRWSDGVSPGLDGIAGITWRPR